jgi:shikimate dehydrogenase
MATLDQYAVIGNPISHSKSPEIHTLFAKQTNQALAYTTIEAPLDGFMGTVKNFFAEPQNKGLNVTVPFKEQAFAMCDELSPRAAFAEAVNTLYMQNGVLWGDNTDGCGLVNDLRQNNAIKIAGRRILLLGAGGASKGVFQPLMAESPRELVLTNRTASKAQALVGRYKEEFVKNANAPCIAENLDALNGTFDLIINATSMSLSGDVPPIARRLITQHTVVYDMMYGKEQTSFNAWASDQGAALCLDGLGMLVEQAAEAFRVWRGIQPCTKACVERLANRVEESQ